MRRFLRGISEWVKANVALVVALNVVLALGLFGVIQLQERQINNNSATEHCWDGVLGNIVIRHPPTITPADIAQARFCQSIP